MPVDPGIALLCLALPMAAAYGVMELNDFPRQREKQHNAKLRAAVKRAGTEMGGLRKALDGAEIKLRDASAAAAAMDNSLRQKIQRMPARDQTALDALIGQGTFSGLMAALRNGVMVDRRLADLKRAWSQGASERECARVLCENLWVLEPALVSEGHIFCGKTLGTVAETYFRAPLPSDDLAVMSARKKPSAIGVFRRRSAIAKIDDPGRRTLVIVEARRPGETVAHNVVAAAIGYAHAMRKLTPNLGDWPIECLVTGGNFTGDAYVAAQSAPPGTAVTLMTWDALLLQARTRRPETVDLSIVRLDADRPPVYDLEPRAASARALFDDGEPDDAHDISPARHSVGDAS